jgi:hypothetical protein
VLSTAALFIALGGAGYAATHLPANSVGTVQLKPHAVTLGKISAKAQAALRGRHGAAGATGPKGGPDAHGGTGPTGQTGQTGATGATGPAGGPIGPTGDTGPSDAYEKVVSTMTINAPTQTPIASFQVPAGSYVVTATAKVHNNSGSDIAPVNCLLDLGTTVADPYSVILQTFAAGNISTTSFSLTKAATFGSPTTLTFSCQDNTGGADSIDASNVHLIAVKVGALHEQ